MFSCEIKKLKYIAKKWRNAMEVEKIDRINALAHKAKSVGLTEEEKKERDLLRKEYLASVRMNLRSQLDNIDVKQEDGSIVNLGERYGIKKRH